MAFATRKLGMTLALSKFEFMKTRNTTSERFTASAGSDVEPSNLWLHMANTHDIVLTSTEENDIKSAALDDYDAERVKWGNRIMRLEGDAAGDRALREDADKRAEVLREALIELVLVTQALGELEIPGAKDAEDVDHILCVGDCRRIAQAVAKAKTILEDSAP